MTGKQELLDSSSYNHGDNVAQNLLFSATLQEFANKVDYICCLETGGKIHCLEAYTQIKTLLQQLDDVNESLETGNLQFDN
ncbi:hypothetical protein H6G04_25675 [Calothrix membranacea FACHB-236]|nr:hypothetical protein [Calothrix membranacea FACHB-236]